MNVKDIVEEIQALIEDELSDEFDVAEISDEDLVNDDINKDDTVSNDTEVLGAKTKISRALDVLVDAVDDFKNVTASEIDLIADADLGLVIEDLDKVISDIRNVLMDNSLEAEEVVQEEPQESEEDVEEPDNDSDPLDIEIDFDDEAQLDLFSEE